MGPDKERYRLQHFLIVQPLGLSMHAGWVVALDVTYGNGAGKDCFCASVLPGTSVAAGWSLSGWQPGASGCSAAGRAAHHLLELGPGHTPGYMTHTCTDNSFSGGEVNFCAGACVSEQQLIYLSSPPCDSVALRKNPALDQPHRTLPP